MSKCDVCGRESIVMFCSSTCGGVSFAYCEECIINGIEPYSALVGIGVHYEDINQDYREHILDPSLKFHGKTREQFDADVDEQYRLECEWFETNKDRNFVVDDFDM